MCVGATPARRLRIVPHALAGVDDRPVAGAATQITRQSREHLFTRRCGALQIQREQRHYEARCAEAALRSVAIDQRTLHRMQHPVWGLQALNGDQFLAVEGGEEADAGIDRTILDMPRVGGQLTEHHRARSAVAFGTSLLGAGAAGAVAQILQHRRGGRHVGNADELAVEHEPRRLCVGKDVTHDKGLTLGVRISYRGKWNSSMAIPGEARDSPAPGLRPRMQ